MEAMLWIIGLFLVFLGYFAAKIEFNRKLKSAKTRAYWNGFEDGFGDAYKDAGEVRRAYMFHFGNLK